MSQHIFSSHLQWRPLKPPPTHYEFRSHDKLLWYVPPWWLFRRERHRRWCQRRLWWSFWFRDWLSWGTNIKSTRHKGLNLMKHNLTVIQLHCAGQTIDLARFRPRCGLGPASKRDSRGSEVVSLESTEPAWKSCANHKPRLNNSD